MSRRARRCGRLAPRSPVRLLGAMGAVGHHTTLSTPGSLRQHLRGFVATGA